MSSWRFLKSIWTDFQAASTGNLFLNKIIHDDDKNADEMLPLGKAVVQYSCVYLFGRI